MLCDCSGLCHTLSSIDVVATCFLLLDCVPFQMDPYLGKLSTELFGCGDRQKYPGVESGGSFTDSAISLHIFIIIITIQTASPQPGKWDTNYPKVPAGNIVL